MMNYMISRIHSKVTSLALFVLIAWYWAPHFMAADVPKAKTPLVAVTLPPLEEPVENEEIPELTEPQPDTVAEEQPEVSEEATQEVVENTPAINDNQPDAEQNTPEQVAEASAKAPAKATGPVTIVGRATNIAALVTWLQYQGGTVWFDDGHFSVGKIYELDVDRRVTKVPLKRFEQAVTQFAPRSMSEAEKNALLRSLKIAAPADVQRLILLWPKSVWADIQARTSALEVDRVQVEYHISGNHLRLRVVNAQRNGVKATEFIGQSI